MKGHSQRAHSKFSASGAERWFQCPGSVALSEGLPDKSSVWAEEGTLAHEVLEQVLLNRMGKANTFYALKFTPEMMSHAKDAADFILGLAGKYDGAEVLVEQKVPLYLHPEAFGTFDAGVVAHWDTLHVFDYKFGQGHPVSVRENLQMIFYCLALAHKYDWNFKKVRAWIIQPRIRGYDGPTFWDIPIQRLKGWAHLFKKAIDRVEREPDVYVEGQHCWWCRAKSICPLKKAAKIEAAKMVFGGAK